MGAWPCTMLLVVCGVLVCVLAATEEKLPEEQAKDKLISAQAEKLAQHQAKDKLIIAEAEKLARHQLAGSRQQLRRAVAHADAESVAASKLPNRIVHREHQLAAHYKRWQSRDTQLAAEGLRKDERLNARRDRITEKRDKIIIAKRRQAHLSTVKEKQQKVDTAVRIAKNEPDPFLVADHTMTEVLYNKQIPKDSVVAKTLLAAQTQVIPTADKIAEKVHKTSAAMYTAVKEKVRKAGTKKSLMARRDEHNTVVASKAVKTLVKQHKSVSAVELSNKPPSKKDIMKLALDNMKGVLGSQTKLVHDGLLAESRSIHQKTHDFEEQLERTKENQAEVLQKSVLQNTRTMKDAHLMQNAVEKRAFPVQQAVHELIINAAHVHHVRQEKQAAQKAHAEQQKKIAAAQAAQDEKMAMPQALANMKSVLKPIQASEEVALNVAKEEWNGSQIGKLRKAVLAAHTGPSFNDLQREMKQRSRNDRRIQLQAPKYELTKADKEMVDKVAASEKTKKQVQKQNTATLLTAERKGKTMKRERDAKALAKQERTHMKVIQVQNHALETASQEASNAVHTANRQHNTQRGRATKDARLWLHNTRQLREQMVSRVIEDNAEIGETASKVASIYDQRSQENHKEMNLMLKQETDWEHEKQRATNRAKLKLAAKKLKEKEITRVALAQQNKLADSLVRSGSKAFTVDPVALSQKVLRSNRKLAAEARQENMESIKIVMGKAHEAESKIKASVEISATKKAASELVHKVPAIQQHRMAVRAAKKMRQRKEISNKATLAFSAAKEKSTKSASFVAKSELQYQTDPDSMKNSIKQLVKQFGVENPQSTVANIVDARQHRLQSIQSAIVLARNSVEKVKKKVVTLGPKITPNSWSNEKNVEAADKFVKDEKYEASNSARYDSLMETLNESKPSARVDETFSLM